MNCKTPSPTVQFMFSLGEDWVHWSCILWLQTNYNLHEKKITFWIHMSWNDGMVLFHQTWYQFPYDLWLTAVQFILAVNVMGPGAVKWSFSPCEKAGCQDYPLEKYLEVQRASHEGSLTGDTLSCRKLTAFQFMQIYLVKNDIFPPGRFSFSFYPHDNPSTQIQSNSLPLHFPYS